MNIHVFSCSYNQHDKSKKCIDILKEQKKKSKSNVFLHFIDNNSKDKSNELIVSSKLDDTYCSDLNLGKAKALNYLVQKYDIDYGFSKDDLIFSLDSDIQLHSDNFFDGITRIWNKVKDQVSCIVCNQSGNSLTKRSFEWREGKDIKYYIPCEGYGNGIAGGALITSIDNWKLIKGYRENLGLNGGPNKYGGADGNIMLDLYTKTTKPIMICENLTVYHPEENNKKYQKWKNKQHKELLQHGHVLSNDEFF